MDIQKNISVLYKTKHRDIDSWIWYSLIIFTISLMFSIALAQLSVGLITILCIVKLATHTDIKFKRTALDIPYIAFVLARILSIIFSSHLSISIVSLYKEIIFYFIFFVFTQILDVTNQKRMILLFKTLFVCAVIAAFYGSAKYILGYSDRASSTTAGYYTLGVFLLVVTSIVLVLGLNKVFFKKRLLFIAGSVICAIGIIFTFNRIHWIALLIIVIIIGLLWQRKLLYVFGLLMCLLLLLPAVRQRMYETIFLLSNMSGRNIIWNTAVEMSTQHPLLGFGPQTFEAIFPNYNLLLDKKISSWHNDYIEIYMESGLIGLCSYIWLMVAVYKRGVACYRRTIGNIYYRSLIAAILFGITGFMISGMAGAFVTGPLTALLFRELLAMVGLMDMDTQNIENINL